MPLVDQQSAETYILDADIYSFTWKLANYNRLADYKDMNEFIQSPNFILFNQSCYIQLYPNGNDQLNSYSADYVSVRIHCKKISEQSNAPIPVKAKGYFSILTNSGKKRLETVEKIQISNSEYDWSISNFIQKDRITTVNSNFLKDGSMNVRFELKVFYEETHVICNSRIGSSAEMKELINKTQKLFLQTEFSDVKFKFVTEDDKELPAHKIILVFRVPFFEKMFQSHMKENTTNTVEIEDIKHDVFKEMLRFIYTGKVENIDALACDLMMAADKYGIDILKNKCAEHLSKVMTVESIMNILEVSNLYNVDYLKNRALHFIKANFNQLIRLYTRETVAAILNDADPTEDQDMEEEESRSEATFSYTVDNVSRMKNCRFSPPCFIRNLPWKIKVLPHTSQTHGKSLGFFLKCDGESDSTSWICSAFAELKLLSCKEDQEPFSRKISHLFCSKEDDWGFSHFMPWQEVLDPDKGYIKNDTITLEVHVIVIADAPNS